MLTKLEYLEKVVKATKLYEDKRWHLMCFAIPIEKNISDIRKENYFPILLSDGFYYYNEENTTENKLEKIVDYNRSEPLFRYSDEIEIDSTWMTNLSQKTKTRIGIMIINLIVFYSVLGKRAPFLNEEITTDKIEKLLAKKVRNPDEMTSDSISVQEMCKIIDRVYFLSNLSDIVNIASTEKIISPPPGINEEKKRLLKEYEGQLNDPVKVVELENKLLDYDSRYLADDPAAKHLLSSKTRDARKKLYGIFGSGLDFAGNKPKKPVINSLNEGLSVTEEDIPIYFNDLRYGSYSRGFATKKSGYTYKILIRSLTGITIDSTPCNTKKGIKRMITEKNYIKLLNRYIKRGDNWILIENDTQAKELIGKEIEIRSPMYCTKEGNKICYRCLNEGYKDQPNAVSNIASEISAVFMGMFLKLMHNTKLESRNIDLEDLTY